MATSYTALLGLALPVTGDLSGTWGDTVNNYISTYIDSAVAGTQTISGTQTAVTLSVTNGTSLVQVGSGSTGSAQYTIINCTGAPASLLTITAPASSKSYLIVNGTSTSQSVKIVGPGPTTGVTLVAAERAVVAWNGSDFVKVASTSASTVNSGTLAVAYGGTGINSLGTGVATFLGTPSSANLAAAVTDETGTGALVFANSPTLVTPVLGTPASGTLTNATGLPISTGVSGLGTGVATFLGTPSSANLAAAVTDETGTGALVFATSPTLVTPALGTPASGTLTNATGLPLTTGVTGTLPVANGGTGQTTYTDGQLLIGNSTGNTLTKSTLTAGSNVTITNSAGGITISAAGGGGGSPAGSNTQVQYNNSGSFGASANLTFSGSQLTINGITAGRGSASNSSNTVFGASSLSGNTTGGTNSGFGASSLLRNTSGSSNSAFGSTALQENTSGGTNCAFGSGALVNNTTGSSNQAFGCLALYSNTTSSDNSAFGDNALLYSTGSNNTAIGKQSGKDITTGSYNTIVGSFYGNSGGLDIRAANNYVVLSDGSGNTKAVYNGTGVGFYTQPTPTSKSTTATLTGAEVLTQILNTTGSSYNVTMPTGTNLDTATGGMPTDAAFLFTVVNTASGTITMVVNTGITAVGSLSVSAGTSATYKIRKTASNTFVMYRT